MSQESNEEFTKQEFFTCTCGYVQHNMIVERSRYKWDETTYEDDLTLHVQLNHFLPWYKRAWRAILFVIAKDAKWYHYAETILSYKDAVRLRDMINDYIESPHVDKSK